MSETIKKHVEKILKTSATVAVVSAAALGHVVKAEELEEKVAIETTDAAGATGEDTAVTIPEAEAKKAVAQTEVDKAQEEKAKADEEVKAADAKVVEAQEAVRQATAERVAATAALEQAKEIAQDLEANPEKPAELEKEIEAKTEEVAKAKATEKEAEEKVKAQEEAVKVAKEEATKAEQAVAEAKKQVEDLEGADQAVAALTEEKATTETTIANLETEVKNLETEVNVGIEAAKVEAESELKKKQSDLTAKEAELSALETEHGKTVTTQGATIDTTAIMGGNSFVITSYPTEIINKVNSIGGYQGYNSLSAAEKTNFLNQTTRYMESNQYKNIATDNYTIDLDNLTDAQQNEIAIFAAELINDVREFVGLSPIEVVAGAQAFADSLTDAYKRKHGTTIPSGYHDFELLNQEPGKNGLYPGSSDSFYYEALGVGDIYESNGNVRAPRTMNELKMGIYSTLKYFLFKDDYAAMPLGHTVNLLRSGSGTVYLGVDSTSVGYGTYHYMVVDANRIADSSKFSTTSISKGTTTTTIDKSAEIAEVKATISSLQSEITSLETTIANPASAASVTSLQAELATKKTEKAAAETKLAEVTKQLEAAKTAAAQTASDLAQANSALTAAQSALTTAQTNLSAEEAKLVPLKASLTTAAASVATLEQEVAALENLLALYNNPNLVEEADAALTAALDAEEKAQAQLSEEEKALAAAVSVQAEAVELLATKQAALDEATALLASLIEEYEGLLVERDEEGVHAVLDENLTEEELPVFEIPADGQVPGGAGASAGADKGVTAGTGAAGAAVVQNLTNKVLTSKATPAATKAAKTATASLPKTGDKSSLVATVLGSMMMSSAALAGYKRRKED